MNWVANFLQQHESFIRIWKDFNVNIPCDFLYFDPEMCILIKCACFWIISVTTTYFIELFQFLKWYKWMRKATLVKNSHWWLAFSWTEFSLQSLPRTISATGKMEKHFQERFVSYALHTCPGFLLWSFPQLQLSRYNIEAKIVTLSPGPNRI